MARRSKEGTTLLRAKTRGLNIAEHGVISDPLSYLLFKTQPVDGRYQIARKRASRSSPEQIIAGWRDVISRRFFDFIPRLEPLGQVAL